MKQIAKYVICPMLAASIVCTACSAREEHMATLHTVSMFGEGDSAAPAYESLIESYSQSHHSITLEDISEVSSEQWKQGVLESFLQEETTPDVLFFFTGADARNLILNNQVVSIEEIRQDFPEYGTGIRESTMEFMREFDGEHYAVPVKGFWEGLFCNTDMFEQYHVSLPTDWDTFQEAINTFRDNHVIPIAVSLKEVPHYWIEHLILSEGGAVEHSLNPKGYIPDSWVNGISWFQTLYELSAFPADTDTSDNAAETELFLSKKAAMILDGSWLVQSIADPETTVVLPFPTTPGGKMRDGDIISGYSSGFYITRKAWEDPKKRDAAVDFVSYMTSSESIAALCAAGGAPAVDIAESSEDNALQQSIHQLQQNAQNACMPIDSKLYKDAWQSICADVLKVAKGLCSAREAVERLSKLNQW